MTFSTRQAAWPCRRVAWIPDSVAQPPAPPPWQRRGWLLLAPAVCLRLRAVSPSGVRAAGHLATPAAFRPVTPYGSAARHRARSINGVSLSDGKVRGERAELPSRDSLALCD